MPDGNEFCFVAEVFTCVVSAALYKSRSLALYQIVVRLNLHLIHLPR